MVEVRVHPCVVVREHPDGTIQVVTSKNGQRVTTTIPPRPAPVHSLNGVKVPVLRGG